MTNKSKDFFICQSCEHELINALKGKSDNYCYLCDPNTTLEECLSEFEEKNKTKSCQPTPKRKQATL